MGKSATSYPASTRKALEDQKAVQLYLAGATRDEVAATLDWSKPRVSRALDRAIRAAVDANREELDALRATEVARLNRLQRAHWADALSGDTDATRTILAIMDRRTKLLGIDPPQRVDLTVSSAMDDEIADLLTSLRALDPEVIDVEVVSDRPAELEAP